MKYMYAISNDFYFTKKMQNANKNTSFINNKKIITKNFKQYNCMAHRHTVINYDINC